MSDTAHLPVFTWFHAFKHAPVRLGVYIGVLLSGIFTAWLFVANRMPLLEPFALERNLGAAALLVVVAMVPVLRFLRRPRGLLLSGLVCWSVFSFVYRILCLSFTALYDWHSTAHIFMLGFVVYLFSATLSWVVRMILGVRAAKNTPQLDHHADKLVSR